MPKHFPRALVPWLAFFSLVFTLTPTIFAGSAPLPGAATRRQTTIDVPGIDPNFIYNQLDSMVTRFQRREAGYDTNLPPIANGHDEFANLSLIHI